MAFLLPVAALACITESIVQMVLAVLAVIAIVAVLSLVGIPASTLGFVSLEWVRSSLEFLVLVTGALAIMILQYRSRRTGLSRILAGATLGVAMIAARFLPWTVAFALRVAGHQIAGRHIIYLGPVSTGRPPAGSDPAGCGQGRPRQLAY